MSSRPYTNLYYAGNGDAEVDNISHGHAVSEAGAVRAAVFRIFLGQYAVARLYLDGVLIHTITKDRHGMRIVLGRA